MSSLEIAELTGKRHDHVMRDIKKMLGELGVPISGVTSYYWDSQNKRRPCFNLDKELTITLITGYSIPLRHAVTVRWSELEKEKQ